MHNTKFSMKVIFWLHILVYPSLWWSVGGTQKSLFKGPLQNFTLCPVGNCGVMPKKPLPPGGFLTDRNMNRLITGTGWSQWMWGNKPTNKATKYSHLKWFQNKLRVPMYSIYMSGAPGIRVWYGTTGSFLLSRTAHKYTWRYIQIHLWHLTGFLIQKNAFWMYR